MSDRKRWDDAIDALLDGRWVEREAVTTIYLYVDGYIDREEMETRLA